MKRPLYFVFPMSLAICRRHYFILTVQKLCAFASFKINSSEIRFSSRGRVQHAMSVRNIFPVSFSAECTDPADDEALRLRRGSPPHSSRRTSIPRHTAPAAACRFQDWGSIRPCGTRPRSSCSRYAKSDPQNKRKHSSVSVSFRFIGASLLRSNYLIVLKPILFVRSSKSGETGE